MVTFRFSFAIILFSILVLGCGKNKHYQKPAIFAGYKAGTLFDIHLLGYDDSTYYYSNYDSISIGNWIRINDTIFLKQREETQAILVNFEPIQIINPKYNWLIDMEFIENDTPKIVKFPSNE